MRFDCLLDEQHIPREPVVCGPAYVYLAQLPQVRSRLYTRKIRLAHSEMAILSLKLRTYVKYILLTFTVRHIYSICSEMECIQIRHKYYFIACSFRDIYSYYIFYRWKSYLNEADDRHYHNEYGINTLRPRHMDAMSQTTFSNAFSWMKMFEFRLKVHWSLFPTVQLTIFQQWFR